MRAFTKEELAGIIESHGKWLRGEGGERADLSGTNLSRADLFCANLRCADLRSADLSNADLRFANLSRANLSGVVLRFANLFCADLHSTTLISADLRSADLGNANLRCADLRSADLSNASLNRAHLSNANLSNANLSRAILCNLVGNLKEMRSMQCDKWVVTYTSELMIIGCQSHKISEWWDFSDDEIAEMDSSALVWWKVWKPILQKIIEVSPATPIVLDGST